MSLLAELLEAAETEGALPELVGTLVSVATASGRDATCDISLPVGSASGDVAVYQYGYDGGIGDVADNGGADTTVRAFGDSISPVGNEISIGIWAKTLTSTDIENGYIRVVCHRPNAGSLNPGVGKIAVFRDVTSVTWIGETAANGSSVGLPDPSGPGVYVVFADLDDDLSSVTSWPTSYTEGRLSTTAGTSESGSTGAVAVAMNVDPGAETLAWSSSDATVTSVVKVA